MFFNTSRKEDAIKAYNYQQSQLVLQQFNELLYSENISPYVLCTIIYCLRELDKLSKTGHIPLCNNSHLILTSQGYIAKHN